MAEAYLKAWDRWATVRDVRQPRGLGAAGRLPQRGQQLAQGGQPAPGPPPRSGRPTTVAPPGSARTTWRWCTRCGRSRADQRRVIVLHHLVGLRVGEIAARGRRAHRHGEGPAGPRPPGRRPAHLADDRAQPGGEPGMPEPRRDASPRWPGTPATTGRLDPAASRSGPAADRRRRRRYGGRRPALGVAVVGRARPPGIAVAQPQPKRPDDGAGALGVHAGPRTRPDDHDPAPVDGAARADPLRAPDLGLVGRPAAAEPASPRPRPSWTIGGPTGSCPPPVRARSA